MLQAIRSRAGSVFVKGLFAVLIVTFGIWGIGDIFRNRPTDTTVATVGGERIDQSALQTALEPAIERLSTQLGTPVDLRQAKRMGIVGQVLDQLVDESLLDQEAQRLQLDVSDNVVRDAITTNPMFHGANGVFDRNAFNALLAANHLSESQYVERLRRDIPRTELLLAVGAGAAAPPAVVGQLYRYRNEKRTAEIVGLPLSSVHDVGQPSDAALTKFYDAHQDMFHAPEYRGLTLAFLTPSDLAQKIKIPEDKLRSAYNQRQDEFVLPERRDVQQILAPTEAKAKAAEAALAQGKDWAEIARTIAGQDPQTIDLGLMKQSELPQKLGDVAFGLPLDKPSAPVQTTLGWHILRVVKIVPPTTQSFAEAKARLQADLAHSQATDQLYAVANRVDDALAGGAALDQAASQFGLKRTVVAAIDDKGLGRNGSKVALPVSPPDVVKLAFATEEGRTSRVMQTQDGAIYALRVDKITPPSVRPLSEVKNQAVAAWQREARVSMVEKEAEALAAEVKPGMKLAAVAVGKGLTATTSPPFQRQSEDAAGVPAVLVDKLFAAKSGGVVTGSDASGSYAAQLLKIEEPQAAAKSGDAALSREVTTATRDDLEQEFTRGLRSRFPVEIHHQLLDQLF